MSFRTALVARNLLFRSSWSIRSEVPNRIYAYLSLVNLISFSPSDDVSDTHSSADRARRAYKSASSKYRSVREWFVQCEGRRRFPPCESRNCGAAYGDSHDARLRQKQRLPSATLAVA